MTKKREARLLRELQDEQSLMKMPQAHGELLEQLIEAKEIALLASMEAQRADLAFRGLLAEVCRSFGQPIERSIVCLSCGTIRPITQERCPGCIG